MAGTCSPVDQMYVTAMPAMATLTMAEVHIKTVFGCSCKQKVGMSWRNYYKHDPAPFSRYNRSKTVSHYISYHTNCDQKKPRKRRSEGVPSLDKPVHAQGGGGGWA